MPDRPQVVIIGAGIIGASIAYHLQRDGAQVTVIEAIQAGGVATRNSWAWINASWGNPEPYFRLRHQSMKLWRELSDSLPGLAVNWCGGLLWDAPIGELETYVTQHRAWGYDIRAVDGAEAARLEPGLGAPPEFAVHVAEEGVIEPLVAAATLLAAAKDAGAELVVGETAQEITRQGSRATGVITDQRRITADHVVIAAGTMTAALAASAGVRLPVTSPPGLLATTTVQPKLLNGLVMAPEMHVRQMADGRLIAGADFGGSDPGADADKAAQDLVATLRRFFGGRPEIRLEAYTIGHRPMPADSFPAVGPAPGLEGLSIAVTHSGITLAPVIGAALSAEILSAREEPLLAPYRPGRFA